MVELADDRAIFEDDLDLKIAAISMQSPEDGARAKGKAGVDFPFLSDRQGNLVDALGLRDKGGNPMDGGDIPRPTIAVIKRDGTVAYLNPVENYRVRPAPEEIAKALKSDSSGH